MNVKGRSKLLTFGQRATWRTDNPSSCSLRSRLQLPKVEVESTRHCVAHHARPCAFLSWRLPNFWMWSQSWMCCGTINNRASLREISTKRCETPGLRSLPGKPRARWQAIHGWSFGRLLQGQALWPECLDWSERATNGCRGV